MDSFGWNQWSSNRSSIWGINGAQRTDSECSTLSVAERASVEPTTVNKTDTIATCPPSSLVDRDQGRQAYPWKITVVDYMASTILLLEHKLPLDDADLVLGVHCAGECLGGCIHLSLDAKRKVFCFFVCLFVSWWKCDIDDVIPHLSKTRALQYFRWRW